jgi:hypothetical protein
MLREEAGGSRNWQRMLDGKTDGRITKEREGRRKKIR